MLTGNLQQISSRNVSLNKINIYIFYILNKLKHKLPSTYSVKLEKLSLMSYSNMDTSTNINVYVDKENKRSE